MSQKDYASVDDYLLDYFDRAAVRERFNRATGSRLRWSQRRAFARFLADEDSPPDEMDQMDAERFILYIDRAVWRPLDDFLAEHEHELQNPAAFYTLCEDFEERLRRDGLWHDRLMDIIRDYVGLPPRR